MIIGGPNEHPKWNKIRIILNPKLARNSVNVPSVNAHMQLGREDKVLKRISPEELA